MTKVLRWGEMDFYLLWTNSARKPRCCPILRGCRGSNLLLGQLVVGCRLPRTPFLAFQLPGTFAPLFSYFEAHFFFHADYRSTTWHALGFPNILSIKKLTFCRCPTTCNPSFSVYFFSQNSVFFPNKSTETVFWLVFSAKQTGLCCVVLSPLLPFHLYVLIVS